MDFDIEIASKSVNIELKRSKKTRHCYIRIIDSGTIRISANNSFTVNDAKELLARKSVWIDKHIRRLSKNDLPQDSFLYLGDSFKLEEFDIFDLDVFYKKEAKRIIEPLVEEYSNKMNLFPKRVKYRKNRRRWGSCSVDDIINFNYYLVKLPIELIEYIVVHELAHIKHKNHKKEFFWKLVGKYMPDFKEREKKLKLFV